MNYSFHRIDGNGGKKIEGILPIYNESISSTYDVKKKVTFKCKDSVHDLF